MANQRAYWTRDEVILVLVALSRLLKKLPIIPLSERTEKFRNLIRYTPIN